MREDQIETVILDRLVDANFGYTLVFPNGTESPDLPRIETDFFGGDAEDLGLKGGGGVERITVGVNINVVVKSGGQEYTKNAMAIAEPIKALFPSGLRLPIDGGTITVQKQPSIKRGFSGKAGWVTPVVLSLLAQN